jgi:hypothetical protein
MSSFTFFSASSRAFSASLAAVSASSRFFDSSTFSASALAVSKSLSERILSLKAQKEFIRLYYHNSPSMDGLQFLINPYVTITH